MYAPLDLRFAVMAFAQEITSSGLMGEMHLADDAASKAAFDHQSWRCPRREFQEHSTACQRA
jgi:hypothetical protein